MRRGSRTTDGRDSRPRDRQRRGPAPGRRTCERRRIRAASPRRRPPTRRGRFTIVFINGEGDYWLDFTKVGYAPKRFEIKRIGDEEVLLADARLTEMAQSLGAVQVVGQGNRALPNRNGNSPDVGGGERPLTNNGVPPDQAGNLAAMAATVAGIQVIPGTGRRRRHVLAARPLRRSEQHDVQRTGVRHQRAAARHSRDDVDQPISVRRRKGGFSGAQIAIQTIPGSNFSRRAMSNATSAPALEWADETAAAQGQKYTNMRLGGNAAGPIALDRAFYNSAYNVGRRFAMFKRCSTRVHSASPRPASRRTRPRACWTFSRTSTSRRASPSVPRLQAQDVAQVFANVDLMPSASGRGIRSRLGAAGNYQRTQPVSRGGLLLTTPAHGGEATLWGANAALVHTNYFWFGVLS